MSNPNLPSPIPADSGYLPDASYAPNGWQAYQQQPAAQPAGLQLGRILAALGRYKWMIVALTILGGAAGYAATRFIPPVYETSATLWLGVGGRNSPGAGGGPIAADPLMAGPNWVGLLTSRTVLGNIVARRRLFVQAADEDSLVFAGLQSTPELKRGNYVLRVDEAGARYTLARAAFEDTPEQVLESGAVGDSVGRSIGVRWQPAPTVLAAGRVVPFTLIPPTMAAAQLNGSIQPQLVPRTSILRLTLTGRNRNEVAPTLNLLVEEFVNTAAEVQTRNLMQVATRLDRSVDSASSALRRAEGAYEGYRAATITQPTDAVAPAMPGGLQVMSPVMNDYYTKRAQADAMRQERQNAERILASIRAGTFTSIEFSSVPSAATSPALQQALADLAQKEAQLRTARLAYTDEHGTVKGLLRDIQQIRAEQLPQATQELIAELRKREGTIEGQIAVAAREIRGIPARAIEEQRLQREVQLAQETYQALVGSYQQTRLQAMTSQRTIAVLDTAVPPGKASNDISLFLLLGGIGGGLALGLLGALVLDRTDKRFRYPEQATAELGLPIVGAVPRIVRGRSGEQDPEEAAQIIEAFRTIRMNLRYAFDGAGSIAVAVSSPGPGDGKSLVSLNLALSFAEAGYRTLLIDGDIRRGELHSAFQTPIVRRPGMVDYLVGAVPLESIFRETDHENLTLVPCGTRRHRGPELLQSPVLNSFVDDMRMRYDAVIVDTPPLAAGIDPFVLGAATGNLMLVLRSGETDRKLAQSRLALAQRLPIRILGAVLNDIQAEGAYRYYSYLYGYSLDDDGEHTAPRLTSEVGTKP
jgi:capsular exopolysaccharide synthesis family protein